MATLQQVKAAVIGFGGIGSAHVRCIFRGGVEGMQLAAVCDIDPAKREALAQQYPGLRVEADFHALLDGTIDAVIIAVPHPMHCAIAAKCLQSGLHVLTEKPVDVSVTAAERPTRPRRKAGASSR